MSLVGLDRLTTHTFDYEIRWLNQFCSLLPKAANLLCLIISADSVLSCVVVKALFIDVVKAATPHVNTVCQGWKTISCQGQCAPPCRQLAFVFGWAVACQTLDPNPLLSLLPAVCFFFSL